MIVTLNEHLAVNVIGYYLEMRNGVEFYISPEEFFNSGLPTPVTSKLIWNPTENIEQAFRCWNAFEDTKRVLTTLSIDCCEVHIRSEAGDYFYAPYNSEKPAEGIATVIAKATGWENDSEL